MTDQAQERVDVIRAVLNRAFPATAHGLLPNEVDDAIREWESHIPRERAGWDEWLASVRGKFKITDDESGGTYWAGYAAALNDVERRVVALESREPSAPSDEASPR